MKPPLFKIMGAFLCPEKNNILCCNISVNLLPFRGREGFKDFIMGALHPQTPVGFA
jgi:hypothetical protein